MPPVLTRLARAFALAGGALACLVVAMTVASVAGRAALGRPVPGDIELTQAGIAAAIALGLPWCQARRGHIIVDFFTAHLRPRAVAVLDAIGALLLAAMLALLAWRCGAGAVAVREAQETTMILGLPTWWTYAVLTPGLALSAAIAAAQAWALARGRSIGVDPS